jgi:capsule biosynthesis phosphatase
MQDYESLCPHRDVVDKLREYKADGYHVILYTSRNMRTFGGNIGLIMANTAKSLIDWLDRNNIPYDEIHFGKPWAGRVGFYVDDRAVRPDEFLEMTPSQIYALLSPKVRTAAGE